MYTKENIKKFLRGENRNNEYKSAKNSFSETDLEDYCAAMSNEKGGRLFLGVNNKGKIIGTKAFESTLNKIQHELFQKLKIRIDAYEVKHDEGRVIVFEIPSRPIGQLVRSSGKYTYPMRVGESLTEMDIPTIKKILNEAEPDYTAQFIKGSNVDSLDKKAIEKLKELWSIKAKRGDYLKFSNEKTLSNLGLLSDGMVNVAALILLGNSNSLEKYLPNSEIIFEWRQNPLQIPHDYRLNIKQPFINTYDELWRQIDARNIRIPFQEGFVQREIWAFDEKSIREAVLNSIAHRDYKDGRSIFIKASPEEFLIESPGGFVPPVTPNNILIKSVWRNRKLAETLEKAGLVERSGQGIDDIFDKTIRDGKGAPDFSNSDKSTVKLSIPAKVRDSKFIIFLEKIIKEKKLSLSVVDLYELEKIRKEGKVKNIENKDNFLKWGLIEKIGESRGSKYILSHSYYKYEGRPGVHTQLVGTSRDEKKLLIINHFKNYKKATLKDFCDIFSDIGKKDVANLLQELRKDGKLKFEGKKTSGYWSLLN